MPRALTTAAQMNAMPKIDPSSTFVAANAPALRPVRNKAMADFFLDSQSHDIVKRNTHAIMNKVESDSKWASLL